MSHVVGDPSEVVVGAVQLLQLREGGDGVRQRGEGVLGELQAAQSAQTRQGVGRDSGDLVYGEIYIFERQASREQGELVESVEREVQVLETGHATQVWRLRGGLIGARRDQGLTKCSLLWKQRSSVRADRPPSASGSVSSWL